MNFGMDQSVILVNISSRPCTGVILVNDHTTLQCTVSGGTGKSLNTQVSVAGSTVTQSPIFSYEGSGEGEGGG